MTRQETGVVELMSVKVQQKPLKTNEDALTRSENITFVRLRPTGRRFTGETINLPGPMEISLNGAE